jgi:hypothetical protein
VAQWDAELLEIGLGQLRKDIDFNFILAERGLVLTEPVATKPRSNINDRTLAGHGS